ncbi:sporulation protein [Xenophilus sp.]|uniref:sporulation protein n=1 Tax=Xenophilus sp. TaxID=1873499 RepID=UPI0037DCADB7
MLLRLLLAVLVLANLGYWWWSRGDDPAAQEREPHRLQQQVRPEVLQLGRPGAPDAPAAAPEAAPAPPAPAAPQ